MFVLYLRDLSLCLIALLPLVIEGPSTLLAQTVCASNVCAGTIAAHRKQVIHAASADTFLLAGDDSSSIAQADTAQKSTGSSTATSNLFQRLTAFYEQDWNGRPQVTTSAPPAHCHLRSTRHRSLRRIGDRWITGYRRFRWECLSPDDGSEAREFSQQDLRVNCPEHQLRYFGYK
jgi:hypothetical protein